MSHCSCAFQMAVELHMQVSDQCHNAHEQPMNLCSCTSIDLWWTFCPESVQPQYCTCKKPQINAIPYIQIWFLAPPASLKRTWMCLIGGVCHCAPSRQHKKEKEEKKGLVYTFPSGIKLLHTVQKKQQTGQWNTLLSPPPPAYFQLHLCRVWRWRHQ